MPLLGGRLEGLDGSILGNDLAEELIQGVMLGIQLGDPGLERPRKLFDEIQLFVLVGSIVDSIGQSKVAGCEGGERLVSILLQRLDLSTKIGGKMKASPTLTKEMLEPWPILFLVWGDGERVRVGPLSGSEAKKTNEGGDLFVGGPILVGEVELDIGQVLVNIEVHFVARKRVNPGWKLWGRPVGVILTTDVGLLGEGGSGLWNGWSNGWGDGWSNGWGWLVGDK